jgi:HAD superfamily hydrolase (TIGR01484 family)
MIKAIILDVDGVIVGEKIGVNSPHPHPDVLAALKSVREKGIPIALCTAKPHFSIRDITEPANLHNPHITDAGAVIIDPIDHTIIKAHFLDAAQTGNILTECLQQKIYVEFYTTEDYFIQENQKGVITGKHTHILQRSPRVVPSLIQAAEEQKITKIMPIASNQDDKHRVDQILQNYATTSSFSWGVHPVALPLQFGIITAKKSSKKEGAEALVKSLGINFTEVLGIGDSTSDWKFMELCGYAATLENGSAEIKELIKLKGEDNYFIGKHVDENGILDIFSYFSLRKE